ncbi:MAG: hypothetical protein ACYDDU_00400 [Dermatophilaceae bacterium]
MPREVSTELQRVVERWRQLPLNHALSQAGRVRALVQSLADGVAEANGVPLSAVPDCGPATLMDQLTVMVYDASATAVTSTAVTSTAVTSTAVTSTAVTSTAVTSTVVTSTLADDLASLRRELR